MKTMGKIPARGFIARLYSATVPTVSIYGKIHQNIYFFLYPHSPAACKYEFFLKHVFLQKFKGYPLLFSAPKDRNDFSY